MDPVTTEIMGYVRQVNERLDGKDSSIDESDNTELTTKERIKRIFESKNTVTGSMRVKEIRDIFVKDYPSYGLTITSKLETF